MRFFFLMALVIFVWETTIGPSLALGFGSPSASMAESKKRKTFIRALKVEPNQFEWEGHSVTMDECWLDRSSDRLILLFKVKIDGKKGRERSIEKKENKQLLFERTDHQRPPALSYNRSRGMTGQQRINFVTIPSPPPHTINLSIDTLIISNHRPTHKKNDTELTIHLDE